MKYVGKQHEHRTARDRVMRVLDLFSGYRIREDGVIYGKKTKVVNHDLSGRYAMVTLYTDGKPSRHSVHRLLAQTFIPNPDNKPQVNHIDGNRLNNALDNLEWVTQSENQLHAYRAGLQVGYKKPTPLTPEHKAALCGSRWHGERRIYHAEGLEFETPKEAAEAFGFNRQTFYNRVNSTKHPSWRIEIVREDKKMPENSHASA